MINKQKIKNSIERRFLKIRGWKDWEEYDKINLSSKLFKNIREELIELSVQETIKEIKSQEGEKK